MSRGASGLAGWVAVAAILAGCASQQAAAPAAVGPAPEPAREAPAPAQPAWSDAWRAELAAMAEPLAARVPYLVTDEDRRRVTSCFAHRVAGGLPEGPEQVKAVKQEHLDALMRESMLACNQAFADWVMIQTAWLPAAGPVATASCLATYGEVDRPFCECVGRHLGSHYTSPAEYFEIIVR